MAKFSKKKKWVRTDGWRGYEQPIYAVAGVNDTGMWDDSPYPSDKTSSELKKFRAKLKKMGVPTRKVVGKTSNVFSANKYLIAPVEGFEDSKSKVRKLLKKKNYDFVWEA